MVAKANEKEKKTEAHWEVKADEGTTEYSSGLVDRSLLLPIVTMWTK